MPVIIKRIYEGFMIILVIFTITTLWKDSPYNSIFNWIVWLIFFVDFMGRFIRSEEKWKYIKKHPFMVVAIIPLDQFFQAARIVRIVYLFRIKTVTKHYVQPVVSRITNLSKFMIIIGILVIFLIESIIVWQIEDAITTYWDALYFIFSQLLFFGRRTYDIEMNVTHWCVILNSIIGVAIHGLAIQWFFNRVEGYGERLKKIVVKGSNPKKRID